MKELKLKSASAWVVGISLATALLFGCGGGGTLQFGTREYMGTQSPGDVWDWTLTDTTFSATNEASGYTYSGTSVKLASGFLKLTIAATTDPGVNVGDTAFGLELPGFGMIIKPMGTNQPPIVCASLEQAVPDGAYDYNWITIPRVGWDGTINEVYGTVTMTYTGSSVTADISAYDFADTLIFTDSVTGTNDEGRVTFGGGVVGSSTANGTFLLDNGTNQGGVVGVFQASASIGMTAVSAGNYRGVLFMSDGDSEAISVTGNGDGTLLVQTYEDVEAGTFEADTVTVTFTAEPSPGLFRGTVVTTDGTLNLVFVVNVVGNRYIVYGLASDGTTILVVQNS